MESATMTKAALVLEPQDVERVLRQDIQISAGKAQDGRPKAFVFIPWANEYRVLHDGREVDGGQGLEELLDAFNTL